MIKPTFVIVILGILASVAIPRLAATREDAEISAAVANLRTLISDAGAYYVVKGTFGGTTTAATAKWNEITNVPLVNNAGATTNIATTAAGNNGAYLKVGDKGCIGVKLVNKNGTAPAYIQFTPEGTNKNNGVCKQVVNSKPVKAYLDATGVGTTKGTIAIGSNTKIYP